MENQLKVSVGSFTSKGRKAINQDFHDICIPSEPLLTTKGVAVALADGISSSEVSQIASKTSVTSFLLDYFSTPETWSVKKSVQRVMTATNSWLYSQGQKSPFHYDKDKGYVCTFSAMILRSSTAYMFHVGDSRIYRLRDEVMEQLTDDHRLWVSSAKSYLNRALGVDPEVKIDYRTYDTEVGDYFLFATDGVYEFVDAEFIISTIKEHKNDLQKAADIIGNQAYDNDSDDNITIQIVGIDTLPSKEAKEIYQRLAQKPLAPVLEVRDFFEGFEILRELHSSHRSHVYLAVDLQTQTKVVLKVPSVDMQDDKAALERFLMEEWISKRISSEHLLRSFEMPRKRNYHYNVTEFIEGQTLRQWMIDNPNPKIETVREMAEQIAKGLLALHRQDMVHQDIRPENIMIDKQGTLKIIDFGSVRVEGIVDINVLMEHDEILGTAQYSAPEYFLGFIGTNRSDIYSLAAIVYEMLSGEMPYGTKVAQANSRSLQKKLKYRYLDATELGIPLWIDEALKRALQPDPHYRYDTLSEFLYDLRHPNRDFLAQKRPPLIERDPVFFWRSSTFALLGVLLLVLINH